MDPTQSMATLAATETGKPLTETETELRKRLSAVIQHVTAERGRWSVQRRAEYRAICDALDKAAAERAN